MLLDVDGTLVDHDAALRQGLTGWLTTEHWATEQECVGGLTALWDDVAERHFPAYRSGEISFQEQRRRRLREFLPHVGVAAHGLDERDLDLVFAGYLRHYEDAWSAYDDAAACLTALRGRRLAVLSNGDQGQQEDKLRRTGLLERFEVVLTSGALGVAKPFPEAFSLACDRLAVDPSLVTYVGDRLDVDACAAATAGLGSVWLDRARSGVEPGLPTIHSLRELPAVLDGADAGRRPAR